MCIENGDIRASSVFVAFLTINWTAMLDFIYFFV
jgi:hypothetical protein